MKLGVTLQVENDADSKLAHVREMGFETCQLSIWDHKRYTEEFAGIIKNALKKYKVEITSFWGGIPGPSVYNFHDGPETLGLVPVAYRFERLEALKKAADFASGIGVRDIAAHAGFIPENPGNPDYSGIVQAIKHLADYCKRRGCNFLFETGQETPVALKRIIQDIGMDNIGVNFDPANFLMYGKANPVDALDILGEYVKGVHAKDGEYPTDGKNLGQEKPLGKGRVNFPAFITKLKQAGYDGAITIEREISGKQQILDIIEGKKYLEMLIGGGYKC